jgi:heat-inducible transcriptional repressor
MKERQSELLKHVIEQHIKTAEPIGSTFLVEQAGLDVSGATVRNEMRALEEAGYLTHPHTSAGRIPTEVGYAHYVEHMMEAGKTEDAVIAAWKSIADAAETSHIAIKQIAKELAEIAGAAVIIAKGKESVYYTGISQLFSQPELKNHAASIDMSVMFDQCELRLPDLFEETKDGDTSVFIGSVNPLGSSCGTVAARVGKNSLIATVGPMRMDYAKHVSLISAIQKLFS